MRHCHGPLESLTLKLRDELLTPCTFFCLSVDAKAYNREGSIAQGLAQQAKVRKAVSYSNWFAVVVGLCAVGMSIYAFLDANDPGVVSYLSTEGTFLTSPVKYGGMLLGAGIGTVALAILGITQIADELASRFFHGTKHVLYRVYLVLAAWSLALFAGVGSASLGLMLKTTSNSDVQRFLRLSTAASAIGCLTLVIVMTIPYASRAF